jgi:TonB family protein
MKQGLLGSFLFHLLLGVILFFFSFRGGDFLSSQEKKQHQQFLELSLVSSSSSLKEFSKKDDHLQEKTDDKKEEDKEKEKEKKFKPTPDSQQIVDQQENPLNDESPEQSQFLSQHNQVVKKQTRALKSGTFLNSKASGQSQTQGRNSSQGIAKKWDHLNPKPAYDFKEPSSSESLKSEVVSILPSISPSPSSSSSSSLSSSSLAISSPSPSSRKFPLSQTQISHQAQAQAQAQAQGVSQDQNQELKEKDPDSSKISGEGGIQSATLDYIPDLDGGLETLLSTKEFRYYTYFRRIRSQLNQYWAPRVKKSIIKIYKKGRSIASQQDFVTKTVILLNPKGQLLKVFILGNSGLRELDQAALEALKEASPFPNPPQGIFDSDGFIRLRWDFVIEG